MLREIYTFSVPYRVYPVNREPSQGNLLGWMKAQHNAMHFIVYLQMMSAPDKTMHHLSSLFDYNKALCARVVWATFSIKQ